MVKDVRARINNLAFLKDTRKHLRNNLTEAEAILWSMLKNSKLGGRKFRRQHSIGYYIVDFYCPAEKLVIELDGQGHYTHEGMSNDAERDKHLSMMGIKVLRFENIEVKENLTKVLQKIKEEYTQQ
jgi:very-short-patch-repair endonuclease